MKNLTEFLNEKLHVGNYKEENKTLKSLCEFFGSKPEETKFLIEYWEKDNEDIFNKEADYYSSALELLIMMAYMLIDDGNDIDKYSKLGLKSYKNIGNNNPYDYSWFEGEDNNGNTILEICQNWICDNKDKFEKIYNFVNKYKKNLDEDKIFNMYDSLGEY